MVALAHGTGFHRCRVRTRVWLGLHEAELFFSLSDRIEKTLFLLLVQRIENRPDFRPEDSLSARRQCDRARQFLPYQDLSEAAESAATVFLGHVEHPEPHFFGFLFQALANLRLQFHILDRVHLDRNQFFLDKLPHRIFEHLQLFRQIKIHQSSNFGFLILDFRLWTKSRQSPYSGHARELRQSKIQNRKSKMVLLFFFEFIGSQSWPVLFACELLQTGPPADGRFRFIRNQARYFVRDVGIRVESVVPRFFDGVQRRRGFFLEIVGEVRYFLIEFG